MTIEITGILDDVIYHNDDNGYSVVIIETEEGFETAVGHLANVNIGENFVLRGSFIKHSKYGQQFKIESYEVKLPTGELSIINYLSSGLIEGIGPHLAESIVNRFGEGTFEILDMYPERLKEIAGIGEKKLSKIMLSYSEQREMKDAMMYLQGIGLSNAFAMRVFKKYGRKTMEMIEENPYRLAEEIQGIGFKNADRIAKKVGIELESAYRIESGIKYILKQHTQEGHTFSYRDELLREVTMTLGVSLDLATESLGNLVIDGQLYIEKEAERIRIFLETFYLAEQSVCKKLYQLMERHDPADEGRLDQMISELEEDMNIELVSKQREAIREALLKNVVIITGGPGTGKTTIVDFILKLLELHEMKVALTAPTGRAAKRITQTTGREAKTIHRLLEYTPMNDNEWAGFNKNEEDPLEDDVIIVDEMSMVDILLMNSLLRAIDRHGKLIMVGDVDQLLSVGSGNVLKDLIDSGMVATIRLDQIFRQSEESMIVVNAHKINQGQVPLLNEGGKDFYFIERKQQKKALDELVSLCKERLSNYYGFDPIEDIQVLAPMKGSELGVENLNRVLQSALNPPTKEKEEKTFGDRIFRVGDKVMQIRNNYTMKWELKNAFINGEGVFNGDIGKIVGISLRRQVITVLYDKEKYVEYEFNQLDEIVHAYAVTVHKSQGSEFPVVVMPVVGNVPILMTRNILYTAVTRAKQLVVLVGDQVWLKRMIENNRNTQRNSGLKEKLTRIVNEVPL